MSNQENEQLSSLMKLLSNAEVELDCHEVDPDKKSESLDERRQKGDPSCNNDYNREDRKYIWDEITEDDSTCEKGGNTSSSIQTCNGDAKRGNEDDRAASIKEKIRLMKREHDLKSDQVIHLKTTLARKKAAAERKLKLIKEDWEKKFKAQKDAHEKKVKEIHQSIEKNQSIISEYNQKKEQIKENLLHVEEKRSHLCHALQQKGRKQLEVLQQRWKNDERKRLASITRQKTAELKKEAAKALEPELRKIVQDHKANLGRKREEIELDIKTTGEEMKLKYDDLYAVKRRDLETEERHLLQRLDDEYEHKMKMLRLEHEQKMEDAKRHKEEKSKKAREFRLTMIQQDEERINAKITQMKIQKEQELSEARHAMKSQLEKLQEEVELEMKQFEDSQQQEIENWKSSRLVELEKKFYDKKVEEETQAHLKASREIEMIEKKLKSELEEKKAKITKERENDFYMMKDSFAKEINNALEHGQKLVKEYDDLLKSKEGVMKEMKELKAKLDDNERKLIETERSIENESHKLTENTKDMIENEKIAKKKLSAQIQSVTQNIEEVETRIETLKNNISETSESHQEEVKRFLECKNKEISKVGSKINRILKSKQVKIDRKEEEFTILKGKLNDLDLHLDTARRDQVAIA